MQNATWAIFLDPSILLKLHVKVKIKEKKVKNLLNTLVE